MQSLEATSSTVPTSGTSDPALQCSWHRDQEHNSNREPDFEMRGNKKTLIIEPSHSLNTGTYYCSTADEVAQLVVKDQGDLFHKYFFILPMPDSLFRF